jgi:hypothetical protein
LEASDAIAYEMENRMERLIAGDENALDLDPVLFHNQRDGMNGKMREIAYCCIFHQLFSHLAYLGLEPLFRRKILPQQFASIKGRGQTGLKRYLSKCLHNKNLHINYARKTDVRHAYGSTKYEIIIRLIEKEIPSAKWIILLLRALSRMSPSGCLIIGGFIEAWLFNFAMSYALRYILSLSKVRRNEITRLVKKAVSFMDDFGVCGSREANVNSAIKKLSKFLQDNFGLELKIAKATKFLSYEQEKERRSKPKASQRGCPSIDIGGYVIHRTYVTIRPAIFLRARRQYLRADAELKSKGFISLRRAYSLISYYGYFAQTNSIKARRNLNVDKLHKTAKETISFRIKQKEVKT